MSRCPRCAGQMLPEDERMPLGWVKVPTCVQCSYQEFDRPTESLEEISAALRREMQSRGQVKRPLDGLLTG